MAEQLLDRTNIVSLLEQVGSEGMPKRMTAHGLLDSDIADGLGHGALDTPILGVMTPLEIGARILAPALAGKQPLPALLSARPRIFALEGIG